MESSKLANRIHIVLNLSFLRRIQNRIGLRSTTTVVSLQNFLLRHLSHIIAVRLGTRISWNVFFKETNNKGTPYIQQSRRNLVGSVLVY